MALRRRQRICSCTSSGMHSTRHTSQLARTPRRTMPSLSGREIGPHGGGHGQQHLPFVAVIEQITHANLLGHGPGDLARLQARGQIPIKLGGQARIASVFPIGVPIGLVRQQQAQRQRLARGNPLRRVHDQLGLHMGGGGPVAGLGGCAQHQLGLCGQGQQQRQRQHQPQPAAPQERNRGQRGAQKTSGFRVKARGGGSPDQ